MLVIAAVAVPAIHIVPVVVAVLVCRPVVGAAEVAVFACRHRLGR